MLGVTRLKPYRLRFSCKHISLAIDCTISYRSRVKTKHAKTLPAIFTKPTLATVMFSDIEALVVALGGEVREGEGARVVLQLSVAVKYAHRQHPASW